MTNRRNYGPDDLRLDVRASDSGNIRLEMLVDILELRVGQYLRGKGHPPGLDGSIILREIYERDLNDSTLRARLLLEAFTESDLLPTEIGWKLSVRKSLIILLCQLILPQIILRDIPSPELTQSSDIAVIDESLVNPPFFHVCFRQLDIPVTEHIIELLSQYIPNGRSSSLLAFDKWFHSILLQSQRATGGYNAE